MGDFDSRYVSIEKETTFGIDPASSPVYGEVDDESFKHIYDTLVREDMSRYASSKVVRGKEYCEGSLNTVMMTDDFTSQCIAGLFATDTVAPGTPNSHVLEEGDNGDGLRYPTYSIHIGRTGKDHVFTGMSVNRMSVSAAVGEFTTMAFDFQGKAEGTTSTLATPTFPTSEPCYFANADLYFNGSATESSAVKSMDFEISLDRDLDSGFSIGNLSLTQAAPVQRRSGSGSIEFNQAVYTTSANEPTYDQLVQNSGSGFIYDASAGDFALKVVYTEQTNRDITFEFFKVFFEAPEASVSGRDHQTMTVPFMMLYENDNDAMTKCTIRNGTASAYL